MDEKQTTGFLYADEPDPTLVITYAWTCTTCGHTAEVSPKVTPDCRYSDHLDGTSDEFDHLVGMLLQVRRYVDEVGAWEDGDRTAQDQETLMLAHTMERQILTKIKQYVDEATQ
jgi:hypothetical protein